MITWPHGKCKPGAHRWQNGQCAKCGLPQSPIRREQSLAVESAVTSTIWAIADDLRANGFADAATRVEAEFLEAANRAED